MIVNNELTSGMNPNKFWVVNTDKLMDYLSKSEFFYGEEEKDFKFEYIIDFSFVVVSINVSKN